MSVVVVDAGKKAVNDLVRNYVTGNVGLFKAALTPDNSTVLGDLTEADFDGYARIALVVDSVGLDGSGHFAWILFSPVTFTKSAGATTNDIYGWFVTINDPLTSTEELYCVGTYSPERGMYLAGDAIPVQPRLKFTPPA